MGTNKAVLKRGIRSLSLALPMFFIGPVVIHSSFKNQQHPLFIPVLGLGIIICLTGMWFMFLGIKTIVKSIFDNEKH